MRAIFFVVLGIFFIGFLFSCDKQPRVCFRSSCLKVEIAQSASELERGLQYRRSLDKDAGMLFIFPQNVEAAFWMKNTLIPLDMFWLDQDKKVVYIEKSAAPCLQEQCPTYGPKEMVRYVLEANAGFADAYNINIGDTATFSLVEIK